MMSTIILLYLVVGTDSYKNPCPSDMPFAVLDTVLMKDCLFGSGNNDNPYGSASTGSPDYYCQKGIAIDNTDTVCSYHGTYQSPNHLVPWGQRNKTCPDAYGGTKAIPICIWKSPKAPFSAKIEIKLDSMLFSNWNNRKEMTFKQIVAARTGNLCGPSGTVVCTNEDVLVTSYSTTNKDILLPGPLLVEFEVVVWSHRAAEAVIKVLHLYWQSLDFSSDLDGPTTGMKTCME